MKEEAQYSILKHKFREWFGKSVPVATPLPNKAGRPMENPVPADLPLNAEAYPFNHGTLNHRTLNHRTRRRRVDNSPDLLKILSSGFFGAGYIGAVVGLLIVILNSNYLGWYPDNWPNQYFVVFILMVLGFTGGLAKGYVSQER